VTARLQLTNPREPSLAPMDVEALADTGSVFLCIPEHVRLQLKLQVLEHREVTLADGSHGAMDLVVRPGTRSVDVNPASPNIASGICMRAA